MKRLLMVNTIMLGVFSLLSAEQLVIGEAVQLRENEIILTPNEQILEAQNMHPFYITQEETLAYHDGDPEWYYTYEGYAAVRFTPQQSCSLIAMNGYLHVRGTTHTCTLFIFDNTPDNNPGEFIADPITSSTAIWGWNRFDFPNVIDVSGGDDFWLGCWSYGYIEPDTLGICVDVNPSNLERVRLSLDRTTWLEADFLWGDPLVGAIMKLPSDGISENAKYLDKLGQIAKLECYPNPFSQKTVIRYSLNENRNDYPINDLRLTIYDLSGRLVKTLNTNHSPLTTAVSWDGRDSNGREVKSGIYFVKAKDCSPGRIVRLR